MPNPLTAKVFDQPMDPADLIDFETTLSQGDDPEDLLQLDENVTSFTLAVTAEAAAAGLQLQETAGRAPSLDGTVLRFWLAIDPADQAADLFSGAGVNLAIELTINTDASPLRRRQRTMIVQVAQQ